MSETPAARPVYPVPETVRHDDFLAATRPLLDLLGITEHEVYPDIHICPGSGDSIAVVTATVVARAVGDDRESPTGERGDGHFRVPQEHAELGYHVTVKVVG